MHVNYNELTKLTGVTYRSIKKRLEGMDPAAIGKGGVKLWDSIEALRRIYEVDKGGNGDGDPGGGGFYKERALLVQAQRVGQELKNAKERGELIPAATIKETWARIVTAAKTQFLALPDRLTQLLEGIEAADDRRTVIDIEVKTILTMLAEGTDEKPKPQEKKKPAKKRTRPPPKKKTPAKQNTSKKTKTKRTRAAGSKTKKKK